MQDPTEINRELIKANEILEHRIQKLEISEAERKNVEEALRESEIRYRSIIENTGTAMIIVEEDMTISFANAEFEKLTGYSREKIIGKKKWTEFVHKANLKMMVQQHKRRRSGKGPAKSNYAFRFVQRNGNLRDIYAFVDLLPGTLSSVASLNDITELKQSQNIMAIQRDLGMALAKSTSLQDALNLCLDAAIRATGFDAGGIYIIDPVSGDAHLASSRGVSDRFVSSVKYYASGAKFTKIILQGKSLYIDGANDLLIYNAELIREGIKSVALIPISSQHKMIGCLNIVSRILDRMPDYNRNALETIASQVGASIVKAQAEESLRESEGKFKDLVEKSMVGVYLIQDGLFKHVNAELANILGYSTCEIINRLGYKDMVFVDDVTRVGDMISKRISGEVKSLRHEFRIKNKKGEIRNAEVYSSLTLYQGRPAIIGTLLDITDRRKAEEKLRHLSIAIEQAAEDVIITDPNGVIEYVNPSFETITGYSRGEAIGRTLGFLKSGIQDAAFYENLWKTLKDGEIWRGRITNRRKDGNLVQEDSTISPLTNSMGIITGYVALKRDVTEAVKLEAQFRQAQKMEAIGTLAGGIAHDFNNILASMMGYAELVRMKTTDKAIYPHLDRILKACNRSGDLVKQILTFSRQRDQEKRPLSVTPIVKEALKLLRSSIPASIEIQQHYNAGQDTVLADPTQIHQVLMNLCTNAVHAMREREGVLEVRLSQNMLSANNRADDPELEGTGCLQIVVSDTGIGIDPAVKDKIFDPFFTTKNPGEGTGLGLSVVYGIVQDHGGTIAVESEKGKGTVFTIHLPLIVTDGGEVTPDNVSIPHGEGSILYVDDEEPITAMGKEMLTCLGYDVTVRFSSHDAFEVFQAHPERYGLIITDMTMPNMTGAKLAKEMLKIRPELPIIMTTGFSERIDEARAKKIGIRELLMKPFSLPLLAQAVKRNIAQETSK